MVRMNWPQFNIRVPAKWVLAGEHSVLRGATAVALPHREFELALSFSPDSSREKSKDLIIEPADVEPTLKELLQSVADAWEGENRIFSWPSGKLKLESNIPIGAGLGSSAALCVALTRWMAEPLSLSEAEWLEFSTRLEHRFHGKSSGMDVAVIWAKEPISFCMPNSGHEGGGKLLGIKNLPKFTFHDTGIRSRTSECILRVERFREEVPALGVKVDELMATSSRLAMEGLILYDRGDRGEGLKLIQQAMAMARECFYSWELVPGSVKRLEEKLLKQGALAVKLTGAGGGGILVALWNDEARS